MERERDMDKLESKRKIEQLKRTVNLDHHDTKSKVHEVEILPRVFHMLLRALLVVIINDDISRLIQLRISFDVFPFL